MFSASTMIILTLIVVILIYLYPIIKERNRFKKLMKSFDGPSDTQYILGDVWRFTPEPDEVFQVFQKLNKQFPNNYRLWSCWLCVVVCNTPEYAETILSNVRYIKKSLLYKSILPWLGTGLLTSTGEKWFNRRKLLTPAFHFNILKRLTQNFEEHNEYLLELLKKESEKDESNIVPVISAVALNIICATSMGVSLKIGDPENDKYRQAIYKFPEIMLARTTKAHLIIDWVFRFHPLYKLQQKLVTILHGFTGKIVHKRATKLEKNLVPEIFEKGKGKLAMLDLLLAAQKRGEIDENGVREEVDTFTFEGHDTVSSAISFALLLIANHKEHQDKIISELDEILGNSKTITYENLLQMNYLELCIKECLRFYPSVPLISRTAEEDIPLDSEHTIPKACLVHITIYDIHRNEKHWPNPEKFDPLRFTPENSRNRHPYAYIPFSAGPRNCIGQKYAMLEMKSIIATILRHYYLEPIDTPDTVVLTYEMILRSKNGIHVKFVSRNKQYK